jgi:hypothetical protein
LLAGERSVSSSQPQAGVRLRPFTCVRETADRGGGTTRHLHTVVVPEQLSLDKQGGTTEVVLRKNGQAIEVVALL